MVTEKAPGKLYIAGEYAVVEKGYPSIIVALDRFAYVSISESENYGSIFSKQYQENYTSWTRNNGEIIFNNRDNPFHYIISAIKIFETFIQENQIKLKNYHVHVNSELDSPSGKKYGLGSSAAVTVATIKALNSFYQTNLTKEQLFKLAALAHLDVQRNGSLGDIAASVYGGWISYKSFDKEWVNAARRNMTINELLNQNWPNLNISKLKAPTNLKLLIGWTQSPSSTSKLVDKVELSKSKKSDDYQKFLKESFNCVNQIQKGFELNDFDLIMKNISKNRQLLTSLSKFSGIEIETPKLKKMIEIANKYNGAAKTSGAGGGDCGIVIIDKNSLISDLINEWQDNDIELLNLKIHNLKQKNEVNK
ncbi:phosphomevalonate kinase [Lactobacillus sp. S2-2]|uniref:phosphomevalonate kinase n=1 Tax=Lactobacillus sp. S2-2 TaxID=2692917 RepID=UPI001F00CC70|nr:phosphomevalonate kinase [Lactobacillus sp. S2-2]MCF6515075.1 phosphomevalonate kinase [Lactobacillus sp. S2-2]